MEIDISDKVKKSIQIGMLSVLLLTIFTSCGVWLWQSQARYVPIRHAVVEGMKVNVSIRSCGIVQELLVEDGAVVQAGQKLARLKVEVTPEEIRALEEACIKAKERYQQVLVAPPQPLVAINTTEASAVQAAYEKAAANKARMEKLYAIGGISKVEYEHAVAEFRAVSDAYAAETTTSRESVEVVSTDHAQLVKIAELQVRQAEMALAGAKSREQAADVLAPVDGIVQLSQFAVGDMVQAGQALFFIRSESDSWIEADVSIADKDAVRLGEYVQYEVDGQRFSGTVFDIIDSQADASVPEDMIKLRISAPLESETVLQPGMEVSLKLKRV